MRIGDYVDDYCSRCKRTTDHSVAAMTDNDVKKVRCRTCEYEHTYRHNKTARKEMTAKEAFDKVLANVMESMPQAPEPKKKTSRTK